MNSDPLKLDELDIATIKALYHGRADSDQQRHAFDVIIKKICRAGALSFEEDARKTAFNEGQRYVGLQLIDVVQVDLPNKPPQQKES